MSESSGERPEPPQPETPEQEPSTLQAVIGIGREIAVSVLIVLVIALVLFGISGVWPPLVAVESDSMEPQIMTGDLVFIVDEDRFVGEGAIEGTGVVPADEGAEVGHEAFERPGDVIVFAPNGDPDRTPIIHRAHLWVEAEENWYDRADERLVGGADDCEELANCPAPNAGFITHGDNNAFYDQAQRDSAPIRPDWVIARGWMRIPFVGHIRLILGDALGALVLGGGMALQIEA